MIPLRSLLFAAASPTLAAAVGLACLPLLALSRRRAARVAPWVAGVQLRLLRRLVGLSVETRGLGNLPPGPVVYAVKHQSALEAYALCALMPDACFVLKREIAAIPVAGRFVAAMNVIAVDRAGGAAALRDLLRRARAEVARGRSIVIFPEGTRTAPGERRPHHPGAAALYADLGLPTVPVALNTGVFWGRRRLVKRPGRAALAFLPPIAPGLPRRVFAERLAERMERETARLVEEARRA